MKRFLDSEQTNSFSLFPPLPPDQAQVAPSDLLDPKWSYLEDEMLLQLTERGNCRKWAHVSRQLNTQFSPIRRSPRQCQDRWNFLAAERDRKYSWSPAEDTAVLYALFSGQDLLTLVPLLPNKNNEQIRQRVTEILLRCVGCAKGTAVWSIFKPNPLDALKAFFYSAALISGYIRLPRPVGAIPEVSAAVDSLRVTEHEVLTFLQSVSKSIGIEQPWTADLVFKYVEEVMERLENELLAGQGEKGEDTLEELLHPKQANGQGAQPQGREANVFLIFTIRPQADDT